VGREEVEGWGRAGKGVKGFPTPRRLPVRLRPVSPAGKERGGCAVKEDNFHPETPQPAAAQTMNPLPQTKPLQ